MLPLILGSSSPFRAQLLTKLGIPFKVVAPHIDEHPLDNEKPQKLACRLSEQKAYAVAKKHSPALIIGSDQVATLDNNIIDKPNNHQNARQQLIAASGKTMVFFTGLALLNSQSGNIKSLVETFAVSFRDLSIDEIDFYLRFDKPYQCAGSFKSEGLGISLCNQLSGDDPNSLIGLPLIKLTELLKAEGVNVLHPPHA